MPGTVLGGRYQLDQARGEATQSASGATQFDATDLSSHEEVSVRIVPLSRLVDPTLGSTTPADAQLAFEQQADIASSLRHPCIESVLDHGEAILDGEKYVYVVGERLAGGSLREFDGLQMPRGGLAIKARLGVVTQMDTLDPGFTP